MKQLVSEATMQQVLDNFDASTREERAALERRCGRFQEDLTAFLVLFGTDLPPRERALTMVLLPVIYDAFIRSGATFRKVRKNEILHAWRGSSAFIRDLKRAQDGHYAEPEVMQVVIEAVLDREPATMVDEAPPLVAVRLLRTVVECLNRAGTFRHAPR